MGWGSGDDINVQVEGIKVNPICVLKYPNAAFLPKSVGNGKVNIDLKLFTRLDFFRQCYGGNSAAEVASIIPCGIGGGPIRCANIFNHPTHFNSLTWAKFGAIGDCLADEFRPIW